MTEYYICHGVIFDFSAITVAF